MGSKIEKSSKKKSWSRFEEELNWILCWILITILYSKYL